MKWRKGDVLIDTNDLVAVEVSTTAPKSSGHFAVSESLYETLIGLRRCHHVGEKNWVAFSVDNVIEYAKSLLGLISKLPLCAITFLFFRSLLYVPSIHILVANQYQFEL